jgi:hypothetical protein
MKVKYQAYTLGTFLVLMGLVALFFYFEEVDQNPEFFGVGYLGWYSLILLIAGTDAFIIGLFLKE